MDNTGKNISVFLKQEELSILKKLKSQGISTIEIFRRGLHDISQEMLTQNNIS